MTHQTALLMLGDSLVEWGDWPELLPNIQVINRGVAGEQVEDLSARVTEEILSIEQPEYILIMSGTNNLLMGNTLFPVIFKGMLTRIAALCPEAGITVNSLMPMDIPGLGNSLEQTNQELLQVADENNCRFLDMFPPFTEQCLPITRPGFLADGIHLSTLGYQVWAREIERHIREES
jgi:lysophospholipase L1-like esterase